MDQLTCQSLYDLTLLRKLSLEYLREGVIAPRDLYTDQDRWSCLSDTVSALSSKVEVSKSEGRTLHLSASEAAVVVTLLEKISGMLATKPVSAANQKATKATLESSPQTSKVQEQGCKQKSSPSMTPRLLEAIPQAEPSVDCWWFLDPDEHPIPRVRTEVRTVTSSVALPRPVLVNDCPTVDKFAQVRKSLTFTSAFGPPDDGAKANDLKATQNGELHPASLCKLCQYIRSYVSYSKANIRDKSSWIPVLPGRQRRLLIAAHVHPFSNIKFFDVFLRRSQWLEEERPLTITTPLFHANGKDVSVYSLNRCSFEELQARKLDTDSVIRQAKPRKSGEKGRKHVPKRTPSQSQDVRMRDC